MSRTIIAESDASIRALQKMILRQHAGSTETIEVSSLEEALPIYESAPFDFAMIDISHPDEKLREFLHYSRHVQKTPVIAFTTGRLSREILQLLVSDHVFAVFPKPFELEEVTESVRAAVEATRNGSLFPKFFGFLRKHDKEEA